MAKENIGDEPLEQEAADVAPEATDITADDAVKDEVVPPKKKSFTEKKGSATRKQADAHVVEEDKTNPVKFVKESAGELKKVVWPTKDQLVQYFFVVLVFVLFIIAYVGVLDLGFGAALLAIFGGQ